MRMSASNEVNYDLNQQKREYETIAYNAEINDSLRRIKYQEELIKQSETQALIAAQRTINLQIAFDTQAANARKQAQRVTYFNTLATNIKAKTLEDNARLLLGAYFSEREAGVKDMLRMKDQLPGRFAEIQAAYVAGGLKATGSANDVITSYNTNYLRDMTNTYMERLNSANKFYTEARNALVTAESTRKLGAISNQNILLQTEENIRNAQATNGY